jgi:integrase
MSRACSTAKEWGYLDSNPATGVRFAHRRQPTPKVTLQPAEACKLLDRLGEPHRTLVFLITVTGMRVSELLGLQWPDIDLIAG